MTFTAGYSLCREINNFSLCYKVGNLSSVKSTQPTTSEEKNKPAEQASPGVPAGQESTQPVEVTTLDSIQFKLNDKNDPQKLLQQVSQVTFVSVAHSMLFIVYRSKDIHVEHTGNRRQGEVVCVCLLSVGTLDSDRRSVATLCSLSEVKICNFDTKPLSVY